MNDKAITANGKSYGIIKLLGKGKGGYSYLASRDNTLVVAKKIHHEPCSYYSFGNKIEAEINDYKKLKEIGIRMPVMFDVDIENEIIIKEYIDGKTIYDLVLENGVKAEHFQQIEAMCSLLYKADNNIDYFPTNFVVQNNILYYIDYECNKYMDEWSFENWGIKYWSQTPEFLKYVREHK